MNTSSKKMGDTFDTLDITYQNAISGFNTGLEATYNSLSNTILLIPQKLLTLVGVAAEGLKVSILAANERGPILR